MIRFALFAALFTAFAALHAAPVGNTALPELVRKGLLVSCERLIDFRAGYEGDFVADAKMKQFNGGTGRVDTCEQWTQSGTSTLNILDRLDLYGVFGASKMDVDWRFKNNLNGFVTRIKIQTESCFLWAAGARAILYDGCSLNIGFGGRYSKSIYVPESFSSNGVNEATSGAHLRWREWQVNLDASYKIKWFTPYIGVKYSNAQTLLSHFSVPIAADQSGFNSFKNRMPVGLYLGCALSNGQYFVLNIEGRVIDEEAVSIVGDFRF